MYLFLIAIRFFFSLTFFVGDYQCSRHPLHVFEKIFKARFDAAVDKALSTGVPRAFVEGCTHGVASALIDFAEALLFYVGAVLIARGMYTYRQMVGC